MPEPIKITVLDAPTGKGRPRFDTRTGRAYTPAKTLTAEARIRHAWHEAGRPTLPADTPIHAYITLWCDRPLDHYRRDGKLTPKGQREKFPFRQKPDVDNAAKLVLDALESYCYPRDVAIVALFVTRQWTRGRSDPPRVEITLSALTP